MTAPIFAPRLLLLWIGAAVLVFAGVVYLTLYGARGQGADTVGPGAFSRSAIGYAGIAELLRRQGIGVEKSQDNARRKVTPGGVLIVAEPRLTGLVDGEVATLLDTGNVLLVLPKWFGKQSTRRASWVEEVELRSVLDAQRVLALAGLEGKVVRREDLPVWDVNTLRTIPAVTAPVQLIEAKGLRPIVASGKGILLGEVESAKRRRFWILSDPDALSNHGFDRDGKALFAATMIDAMRVAGGNVVFDETIHGFVGRSESRLKLLFEYPFVLATVQAGLTLALLLWATLARFGAPAPPPRLLSAGKEGLIANAAKLLEFGGHQRILVRRYVQATIREVARQIHAPAGRADGALIEWLSRVGRQRQATVDCREVASRAEALAEGGRGDAAGLVGIARDIHRWKREMLDGAPGHSRRH
jgi:hypothetical protein